MQMAILKTKFSLKCSRPYRSPDRWLTRGDIPQYVYLVGRGLLKQSRVRYLSIQLSFLQPRTHWFCPRLQFPEQHTTLSKKSRIDWTRVRRLFRPSEEHWKSIPEMQLIMKYRQPLSML